MRLASTGVLKGEPDLFLIDNLDVAVDQNPFPFRHGRVPADLFKGDGLPLHQRWVREGWKRDMRTLEPGKR